MSQIVAMCTAILAYGTQPRTTNDFHVVSVIRLYLISGHILLMEVESSTRHIRGFEGRDAPSEFAEDLVLFEHRRSTTHVRVAGEHTPRTAKRTQKWELFSP